MKLNLGCGKDIKEGYINCDIQSIKGVDKVFNCADLSRFKPASVDLIFCNAFFEHLYLYEQVPFLKGCYRILKDQGYLVILAIPDFESICKAYLSKAMVQLDFDKPFNLYQAYRLTHGDFEDGVKASIPQFHKAIFDKERLFELVPEGGFIHHCVFSYDCPNELGNLSLGIVGTKKQDLDIDKVKKVLSEFKGSFAPGVLININEKNRP